MPPSPTSKKKFFFKTHACLRLKLGREVGVRHGRHEWYGVKCGLGHRGGKWLWLWPQSEKESSSSSRSFQNKRQSSIRLPAPKVLLLSSLLQNTLGGCLHRTDMVHRSSQLDISPSAWLGLWTHSGVRMLNGRRALLSHLHSLSFLYKVPAHASMHQEEVQMLPSLIQCSLDLASWNIMWWTDRINKPLHFQLQKPNSSSVNMVFSTFILLITLSDDQVIPSIAFLLIFETGSKRISG